MRLSNAARKENAAGEIVNLMSVDAQKFVMIFIYLNLFISGPTMIILAFIFMWNILGAAMLAGIVMLAIFVPFNIFIAGKCDVYFLILKKYLS